MDDNATQFTISIRDIAEDFARSQGITEGKWIIGASFSINAGNMGPSPDDVAPTAMVRFDGVTITKAPDNYDTKDPMLIDASTLYK